MAPDTRYTRSSPVDRSTQTTAVSGRSTYGDHTVTADVPYAANRKTVDSGTHALTIGNVT
jgi:hypothetical protein